MLTRTSGVLAISEMLAVGACWANAIRGCIITADKATIFRNLRTGTIISLRLRYKNAPPDPETRVCWKSFEQFEKISGSRDWRARRKMSPNGLPLLTLAAIARP